MKTKVYSYRRFSSGRQAQGHSLQRQIDSARRWCLENDCELDESLALADLGVSAYKGTNASRGALAGFLTAVDEGKVPKGSVLLVESLDRISRAALPDAIALLTQIVSKGVRVVSLIDGKEWNEETIKDTLNFMVSVILFSRAHEESATKAKRVSASFQRKRAAKLPVVSIMHGPGWVKPKEDKSGWAVDVEKAASVVKVFELAAGGHGGVTIARKANTEQWALPSRKRKNSKGTWEHTGISRLLKDRRVLGEWQPHRIYAGELVSDGEAVKGYFPQIINDDLWHKAQIAIGQRTGPKRVRGIKADIFAGLFFCKCGARMERKAVSGRGTPRYYCSARKAGLKDCPSVSERLLTTFALKLVAQAEQQAFRDGDEVSGQQEQLMIAESKLSDLSTSIEHILDTIQLAGPIKEYIERLKKLQAEKEVTEKEIASVKEAIDQMEYLPWEFGEGMAALATKAVEDKSAVEERHKIAVALNSVVQKIVWHGSFFMIHLRRGGALSGLPPKELLKPYARLKTKGG